MPRYTEDDKLIEVLIGKKIQDLRVAMGLSRGQLAPNLGVTHQQLAKYEYGVNSISPTRMLAMCKVFRKPVSYFYEGFEVEGIAETPRKRITIELSRNFAKIRSPQQQDAINNLVRTLAKD